jgi:hypothetical protein
MLTHPTLEQMNALGLAGMATAYRELLEQAWKSELRRTLGLMLDREIALCQTGSPPPNCQCEDIDFGATCLGWQGK